MANQTNASAPFYSYEYYLDYLDLIPVDEKKLKANKHSIVIVFWVSLAAFVVLLFLILLCMSWSGSPQMRNNTQHHPTRPWSHSLNLPLCVWRHPPRHRAPRGNQEAPLSSVEEPGSRTSGPDQRLQPESPSASSLIPHCPPGPPCPPLGTGPRWGPPQYQLSGMSPASLPLEKEPPDCRTNTSKP